MTYKDVIAQSMTDLGKDPSLIVVGYNVCKSGGSGGGSFNGIPESQRQEMPLAENLMMGAAIGLSLSGHIPLLWLERFDFATCLMDALVNHLDKLSALSEGIHRPACIIRAVVGNSKTPLYTGAVHTQDLSDAIREMVSFPVVKLTHKALIAQQYQFALGRAKKGISTLLVEYKDMANH